MALFDDTRADWNASKGRSMYPAPPATRSEFYNHYDGEQLLDLLDFDDDGDVDADDHAACLRRVKAVQTFHQGPSRGWSDIGYNGLVCQHGRAIEGRGADVVGAHCPNHNQSAYGFQFMIGGNEQPTQAAKNRMRRLYDDCSARSGRQLAKRGHRDGFSTLCPGDVVYEWVRKGMPASTSGGGAQSLPTPPRSSKTKFVPLWTPTGSLTTKQVQEIVNVTADGLYGAGTKAAVAKYQKTLGVAADGYWGKDTEAKHYSRVRPKDGRLTVDGLLGPATYRALQKAIGARADGIWGNETRRALQRHLGVKVDGLVGRGTIKALQRKVGVSQDGIWGPATTRALQNALNKRTF